MLKNCGVRVWSRTGANFGDILNTTLRVRDSWHTGNFTTRKSVNFPRITFRWRNWLAVETEWQSGRLTVHKSPATAGNKLLSLCPGCKYTLVHACSNRWLHPEKVRVGRPLIRICEVLTSFQFPEFRTNWTERKYEK